LTLLDSFRALGLPARPLSDREQQETAAAAVLAECRRLGRKLSLPAEIVEDAVAVALMRMTMGVHHRAQRPPGSDDEVRAYLFQAIRHNALALLRRRQRETQAPAQEERPWAEGISALPQSSPDESLDRLLAGEALTEARRELREVILPAVAAALRSDGRATLLESFADLEGVAAGTRTLGEVVARRARETNLPVDSPQIRNWFDQRCTRVRRSLLEYVRRVPAATAHARRTALEAAIEELRLRE
jgi:DNA-directed RNA polymerase specialized sigma24 family protein